MLHELICYKGSHGVRHGVTFCAQPNFTAPLPRNKRWDCCITPRAILLGTVKKR